MKLVLPSIILETQSAFVPKRLITNDVLVAYELVHFLNNQRKGKEGFMSLKLDMSKADDRMMWDFLERILLKYGFAGRLVGLIMSCVTSVPFFVIVNGIPTDTLVSSRGIR